MAAVFFGVELVRKVKRTFDEIHSYNNKYGQTEK